MSERSDRAEVGVLERWFATAVLDPRAASSARRNREAREQLLPSAQLSAVERLEIYANGCFLRFRDVLRSDFAGVDHALGDATFSAVVREFLALHPSTSFTLNALGAPFASYLAREATPRAVAVRRRFLFELATLERAVDEVFHERVVQPAATATLQSIPVERWATAHFTLIPAARLFAFRWPVHRYLQEVYDQKSPEQPKALATWVLVHRRDWRVWRTRLSREQHALLAALAKGDALATAIQRAAATCKDAGLLANVGAWFTEWAAEGLFAAIETR